MLCPRILLALAAGVCQKSNNVKQIVMKQKSKKQTKVKEAVSSNIDMLCPRCGAMMRAEGGCRICPLCGYTPCG